MARYTGPKHRLARREGENILDKTSASLQRRLSTPPGVHGKKNKRRLSEYGLQLREKQKAKVIYGLLEKQMKSLVDRVSARKGDTGELLMANLETRLDNLVYRLGFAPSRKAARQLVRHRHFLVNGKIVDVPSFQLRPSDLVRVKDKSRKLDVIHLALKDAERSADLPWIRLNKAALEGELLENPKRADIPITVSEQLVVELYSK